MCSISSRSTSQPSLMSWPFTSSCPSRKIQQLHQRGLPNQKEITHHLQKMQGCKVFLNSLNSSGLVGSVGGLDIVSGPCVCDVFLLLWRDEKVENEKKQMELEDAPWGVQDWQRVGTQNMQAFVGKWNSVFIWGCSIKFCKYLVYFS